MRSPLFKIVMTFYGIIGSTLASVLVVIALVNGGVGLVAIAGRGGGRFRRRIAGELLCRARNDGRLIQIKEPAGHQDQNTFIYVNI